ncbi:MAG TPA: amidohydrolase family protein [Longimicrobium sp.]|jgi:hypothetical protein|uniref:amidohydrolase family protein n=1 Tax=Longimicrobium sp. TaxID=2029185 RepID=UPI002ED97A12
MDARRLLPTLLLTACASSSTAPRATPAPPPDVVAFVGVHLLPMDAPQVLRDQTVVVRDGRIATVGPAATTPVPADARRIEGRGRYLMPGLSDMHVHLAADGERLRDEMLLYLANGVTTVRNMDGRPVHLAWRERERVAAGSAAGPAIRSCGPQLFGRVSVLGRPAVAPDQPAWLRRLSRGRSPASARAAVAAQHRAGYDCVKLYSGPEWSAAAYEAVTRATDSVGLPLAGHFARNLPLEVNLRGRSSVDHVEEFNYTHFFRVTKAGAWAARDSLLPGVARRVADSGVAVTTTLWYIHLLLQLGVADSTSVITAQPDVRFLPASRRRVLTAERHPYWSTLSDGQQASMRSNLRFQRRMVHAFQAAGVRVMTGTDASLRSLVVPGFSLHREVAELVEAGLTPYDALHAATAAPAAFLGTPGGGRVVEGGRADLLLLEANPLDDVRNLARRAGVMANGRWWPEAELADSLRAVEARASRR